MAHEKFYAICEDKCQVDITDKVVKYRAKIVIPYVLAGDTDGVKISFSQCGIDFPRPSGKEICGFFTVASGIYPELQWSSYVNNEEGYFLLKCTNTSGKTINKVSVVVVLI